MTIDKTIEEYLRGLPLLLGIKQVQDCLGISRAGIYRRLADGSMMPPTRIGSTNRWRKDYIRKVMEGGFEKPGTYCWKPKHTGEAGETAPAALN